MGLPTYVLRQQDAVAVAGFDQLWNSGRDQVVPTGLLSRVDHAEGVELYVDASREQLQHERHVVGHCAGVSEDRAAEVRALFLDDVEHGVLLGLQWRGVERDRRAGEQTCLCRGANAPGLVVGDGIAVNADLSDDAGADAGVTDADSHVVDDLVGQGLDAARVHVVRVKDLLVPAGAHDYVESGRY